MVTNLESSPLPVQTAKALPKAIAFVKSLKNSLQRRFDLKPPGLEQRLRDILGILVTPRPLPKTGGPDILVRGQLELLHDLLEGGYRDRKSTRLNSSHRCI